MILVPIEKVEKFTTQINKNKSIQPVKIKYPDTYILPESILEDKEITKVLPELLNCKKIDKKDIVFINVDIEQ